MKEELFSKEGGNLKLGKCGLTLPISLSTTHSWMIRLGYKYDRHNQSYYHSDGHERDDDVVSYCKE